MISLMLLAAGCGTTGDLDPEGLLTDDAAAERDPVGAVCRVYDELVKLAAATPTPEVDAAIERGSRLVLGLLARAEFDALPDERGHLRPIVVCVMNPPTNTTRQHALDTCAPFVNHLRNAARSRPSSAPTSSPTG